jgi:FK506-binding protein 1
VKAFHFLKKIPGMEEEQLQIGDKVNFPRRGQTAFVHYTATTRENEKIDSSRDRGKYFQFKVGLG